MTELAPAHPSASKLAVKSTLAMESKSMTRVRSKSRVSLHAI